MKKLLGQAARFLLVSGTGWLLDFSIFILLTRLLGMQVAPANMLSAIPSLTFVFFVSTRKIFQNSQKRLRPWAKYLIYFAYQMVLLAIVSFFGQYLYEMLSAGALMRYAIVAASAKLLSKIAITPITMLCNFVVMKLLSERV